MASGSSDKTCEVWSISKKKKLYSVKHNDYIWHVQLVSDQKLGFDLITASDDKTVKLWRNGQAVKTLKHSNWCNHCELDKQNRLLAVATDVGVTLWRTDDYSKIDEVKIGRIFDVRFNANSTKLIAAHNDGPVHEIALE